MTFEKWFEQYAPTAPESLDDCAKAAWEAGAKSALLDACEEIQVACMNGEIPDVCEEAIRVITID